MRRARLVATLAVLLLTALGASAAGAGAAEVLFQQPVGPSGIAVPSNRVVGGGGETTWAWAMDDFVVPDDTHWHPSAIQVFGTAEDQRGRSFVVTMWKASPGVPYPASGEQILREEVPAPGTGPDYLIPIEGAPRLEPGSYWISVQALSAGEGDQWSWLTGPDTPGTEPASFWSSQGRPEGAEPGQAFQLLGTATQFITVYAESYGSVVSEPPGLDCATICQAEFPRGTTVTLSASPLMPAIEFTGWALRGYGTPYNQSPRPTAPPCTGSPCTFTLSQDLVLGAVFKYVDHVSVLRFVPDRRTGRGQLLVWLPGEGVLGMSSGGVKVFYTHGPVAAGLVRIPLVPRPVVARRLRRRGRVTVSVAVEYRPTKSISRGTTREHLTLLRKRPGKPTHPLH